MFNFCRVFAAKTIGHQTVGYYSHFTMFGLNITTWEILNAGQLRFIIYQSIFSVLPHTIKVWWTKLWWNIILPSLSHKMYMLTENNKEELMCKSVYCALKW